MIENVSTIGLSEEAQALLEALYLACEYFGSGDCPINQDLEFKGCKRDNCDDENVWCWVKYFLEKAERSEL